MGVVMMGGLEWWVSSSSARRSYGSLVSARAGETGQWRVSWTYWDKDTTSATASGNLSLEQVDSGDVRSTTLNHVAILDEWWQVCGRCICTKGAVENIISDSARGAHGSWQFSTSCISRNWPPTEDSIRWSNGYSFNSILILDAAGVRVHHSFLFEVVFHTSVRF